MMSKFWKDEALRRVIEADTGKIAELVALTGVATRNFFRGTDFRGVDLRGQDLSDFDISFAKFDGAIVDSSTTFPRGYVPITDKERLRERLIALLNDYRPEMVEGSSREIVRTALRAEGGLAIIQEGRGGVLDAGLRAWGLTRRSGIAHIPEGPVLVLRISGANHSLVKRALAEVQAVFPSSSKAYLLQMAERRLVPVGNSREGAPKGEANYFDAVELLKFSLRARQNDYTKIVIALSNSGWRFIESSEISFINRSGILFNYVVEESNEDLIQYWRSVFRYNGISDISAGEMYIVDDPVGNMHVISEISNGELRFSKKAFNFVGKNFSGWDDAKPALLGAVLKALIRSSTSPVIVDRGDFD